MTEKSQQTVEESEEEGAALSDRVDDSLQEELRAHQRNVQQGIGIIDSVEEISENEVAITFKLAERGSFTIERNVHGVQFGRLLADAGVTYDSIGQIVGHAVEVNHDKEEGWTVDWTAVEREPFRQCTATVQSVREGDRGKKAVITMELGTGRTFSTELYTYGDMFSRLLAEADATYRTIDTLAGLTVPVEYTERDGWSIDWKRVTNSRVRSPSGRTDRVSFSPEERRWIRKRFFSTVGSVLTISFGLVAAIGLSEWLVGGVLILIGLLAAVLIAGTYT